MKNNEKLDHDSLKNFEKFLKSYVQNHLSSTSWRGHHQLLESIRYSLLTPGKRFRPLLIFNTATLCSVSPQTLFPWAGAIEMIHTASLIHDDLPVMDCSLVRRNQACNHRLFGEDMALLAGNCLWIEAFRIIPKDSPHKADLVDLLCQCTGFHGLMGGQALDLRPESSLAYYRKMQEMKTASLITASIQGVLALAPKKNNKASLQEVARDIGMAFQLADDLEDQHEDPHSLVSLLGPVPVQQSLKQLSQNMLQLVRAYPKSQGLSRLILWNARRAGVSLDSPF